MIKNTIFSTIKLNTNISLFRYYNNVYNKNRIDDLIKNYENPITRLQELVDIPLTESIIEQFNPSEHEIESTQTHFCRPIINMRGVPKAHMLPVNSKLSEVVFIGSSNCGKSSLIKSLFYNPAMNKVKISISKKPGHTNAIKMYNVDTLFSLVDMPGYGINMPSYFIECVEEYLQKRKQLTHTFLLVDCAKGIDEYDEIGIEMLAEFAKPFTFVFTKTDLIDDRKLIELLLDLKLRYKNSFTSCLPQPFLVSSKDDSGISFLRSYISFVTGNLNLNEGNKK